jgi:hypothetical protein
MTVATMPALAAPVTPDRPDRAGEPGLRVEDFERIEDYLRSCVEGERFRSTYPLACGRWLEAWEMLWGADSKEKVIAVGGLAREAMREFARSLAAWHGPAAGTLEERRGPGARNPDSAATLELLSAVIEMYRERLGESRCGFLDALLDYWRALNEVVRRHEEGAGEGLERLRWEDGRRAVVFTALVMVELDRCL